jgi:hypothetical protein
MPILLRMNVGNKTNEFPTISPDFFFQIPTHILLGMRSMIECISFSFETRNFFFQFVCFFLNDSNLIKKF